MGYVGHIVSNNRHGRISGAMTKKAGGTAEPDEALPLQREVNEGTPAIALGRDDAHHGKIRVETLRELKVTLHVAHRVTLGNAFGHQRGAAIGEELFLPGVELRRRQAGLLADLGDRLLLDEMEPRQSDLVVRGPMPTFFLQGLAPKTFSPTFLYALTVPSGFR